MNFASKSLVLEILSIGFNFTVSGLFFSVKYQFCNRTDAKSVISRKKTWSSVDETNHFKFFTVGDAFSIE